MAGDNKDHRVRQRAYEIWQSEGQPDGHHERHWHQANQEMDGAGSESMDTVLASENTGDDTAATSADLVGANDDAMTGSSTLDDVSTAKAVRKSGRGTSGPA